MKRTRKWKFVSEEARQLAGLNLSADEIARRLQLDPSTVRRWVKAGRLPGAKVRRRRSARAAARRDAPGKGSSARSQRGSTSWERALIKKYEFTPTERELVRLASQMLALAQDQGLTAPQRATCAGRFDTLTQKLGLLDLERDINGETSTSDETGATNVRRYPRPA